MTTVASSVTVKVLLVEDNPGDARLVQEMLRNTSPDLFEVTWVERLSEAMARLADNPFDIILLDLSLPDASGLETLTRMQNAAHKLPIIVLTERSDETLGLQALGEGAQDYLLKQNLDSFLLKRVLHYAIERKRVDQVQRESEERFRALVQNSTDVITILAADMTVLYESPSLEKVTGYQPEAVQGLRITEIIHPDDLPLVMEKITTLLAQPAAAISVELRLRHADGSWRTQEATLTNHLDHPAIHGIVVNSRDITERRRSEEAIRFQAQLLNTVGQAVIASNLDNKIIYWNRFAEMLYGWSAAEALGRNIVDLTPADASREQAEAIMARLRAGERWQGEFTVQRRDGTTFPALVTDAPVFDEAGTLMGVIGVSMDISERKEAEKELASLYNATSFLFKSDSLLNLAHQVIQAIIQEFQQADCGLILKEPGSGQFIQVARAGAYSVSTDATLLVEGDGLVPEGLRTGQIIYAPDMATDLRYQMSDSRTRSELVIPLKTVNGTLGALDLQSTQRDAFSLGDQRVLNAFAERAAATLEVMQLYEELSRHAGELESRVRRRTAELQRAKEQVEAILNQSSDAIILARADTTISQANPAFYGLLGYTTDETLGRAITELTTSLSKSDLLEAVEKVIVTREPMRLELALRRRDGTNFDADMAIAPVVRLDTDESKVIFSLHDITLRKQAERDLRQAWAKEKDLNDLKTRFVSMVSHDFRTPLASIQSSSDLLQNYSERMTDEKKEHHFTAINGQIKHLTGLLEDMLTVTQADSVGLPFHPAFTDLDLFCQMIADEMQALAGTRQIRFRINRPGEPVSIDPNLLRRALINLLSNAVKYSPEGGVAEFSVWIGDESIEIRVKDQGIGIPEADQVHLFEVFHRASNVGSILGTGLGLAIVKQGVDAHGGTITVQSEVGIGSSFTISLPLLQAEAAIK